MVDIASLKDNLRASKSLRIRSPPQDTTLRCRRPRRAREEGFPAVSGFHHLRVLAHSSVIRCDAAVGGARLSMWKGSGIWLVTAVPFTSSPELHDGKEVGRRDTRVSGM